MYRVSWNLDLAAGTYGAVQEPTFFGNLKR